MRERVSPFRWLFIPNTKSTESRARVRARSIISPRDAKNIRYLVFSSNLLLLALQSVSRYVRIIVQGLQLSSTFTGGSVVTTKKYTLSRTSYSESPRDRIVAIWNDDVASLRWKSSRGRNWKAGEAVLITNSDFLCISFRWEDEDTVLDASTWSNFLRSLASSLASYGRKVPQRPFLDWSRNQAVRCKRASGETRFLSLFLSFVSFPCLVLQGVFNFRTARNDW